MKIKESNQSPIQKPMWKKLNINMVHNNNKHNVLIWVSRYGEYCLYEYGVSY